MVIRCGVPKGGGRGGTIKKKGPPNLSLYEGGPYKKNEVFLLGPRIPLGIRQDILIIKRQGVLRLSRQKRSLFSFFIVFISLFSGITYFDTGK